MRRQQGQGPPPGVVDDDALAVPEVVPRGHEEGQRAFRNFAAQPPRRRLLPVHRHVDVDVARPPDDPQGHLGLLQSKERRLRWKLCFDGAAPVVLALIILDEAPAALPPPRIEVVEDRRAVVVVARAQIHGPDVDVGRHRYMEY